MNYSISVKRGTSSIEDRKGRFTELSFFLMAKILITGNPQSPLVRERGLVGREAGHEIYWFHRTLARIPGVAAYSLPGVLAGLPWFYHLFELIYLARAIKAIQPNLIHVHYASKGLLALPLSRFHPLVVTVMGSDISDRVGLNGLYAPFTRRLLESADRITVKSASMAQAVERIGKYSEKLEIITWGVDLDLFRPDRNTAEIRHELEIGEDTLVFLTLEPCADSTTNTFCWRLSVNLLMKTGKKPCYCWLDTTRNPII